MFIPILLLCIASCFETQTTSTPDNAPYISSRLSAGYGLKNAVSAPHITPKHTQRLLHTVK